MKILGERILATEFKQEEKTEGGIIIPETAQKDTKNLYKIVAVGEEIEHKDLVEGNVILVASLTAKDVGTVPLGDNEFKIFTKDQIIGVDNGS